MVVGLENPEGDAEKISEVIKTRLDPMPEFKLRFYQTEDGKVLIILDVYKGDETPYYYSGDGVLEAYVRVGNESVKATATELKRLVLRGKNTSYDSQNSTYKAEDYAFSKLKERYKKWTGNSFDDKDLISFGLVNEQGNLTNAGALLADESPIRCSRLFCTRWNGLNKSGGAVDALDDAEYSGSVISLIENGEAFIKRNCKMKWRKTANELIDKCTKEIEKKDQQMRDQALALIIKEAKKSVFDGWTDWRYDLLKSGICLCDEKSAKKLEKVLDTLLEISQEDYLPEYTKKEDLIVRYLLHRHLYGKKNMQKELYQNISINELRIIAIKDAMEEKNYDEAEKLCLEKANAENTWHYRSGDPEDWNNMLYDIYKTANNTEKQIAQAKKLLLMGNEKFWEVLKQIYKECGAWNENYESLLDELKDSKRTVCYRSVLISENEKKRLLEDVMENPYDLFYYGKYLIKENPEQVYELCYKEISESCAQAKDRREYKKITKNIAQLIKWKGNDTAKSLIEELKQRYPRKPALLDELEKVEKKL